MPCALAIGKRRHSASLRQPHENIPPLHPRHHWRRTPARFTPLRADILYVANDGDIEKFTSGGVGSVFASMNSPTGLAFDSAGNLYASNFGNFTITKLTPLG